MKDWGEIKLKQIDEARDFWCLIDELCDDQSGFLCNRNTILDAFTEGNLYGLKVVETDEMYEKGTRLNKIFCKYSNYLLPCFCIKDDDTVIIIWTHTRARKLGFARRLVELLQIKYASSIMPESVGFWNKMNIGEPPKKHKL